MNSLYKKYIEAAAGYLVLLYAHTHIQVLKENIILTDIINEIPKLSVDKQIEAMKDYIDFAKRIEGETK